MMFLNPKPARPFMNMLVGALFLVGFGYPLLEQAWENVVGQPVSAVVDGARMAEHRHHRRYGGSYVQYEPVITYHYTVNGTSYQSEQVWAGRGIIPFMAPGHDKALSEADALLREYPSGTTITAFYDPTRPGYAFLRRDVDILTAVMAIAGLIAFLWGFIPVFGVTLIAALWQYRQRETVPMTVMSEEPVGEMVIAPPQGVWQRPKR